MHNSLFRAIMLLMKKEENMLSNYTFVRGMRDGIPICLGYFAVSFALGIAGRGVGMNAVQAFVMSLTMVASPPAPPLF